MQLSPEQFHTLFDRAAQPVLLVQDGVITQCSSRAEGLIAPGSPIRELLPPDAVLQELIAAAPTVLPLRLRTGYVTAQVQPLEGALLLFLPVGDDEELRSAQDMCRRKIADKHFAAGVSIMDPNNTYIDPRVKIGSGTVILPGTILRGRTVIGKNCTIGPNAMIRDCTVGDETEVNASQLNESTVGAHTTVGPFAYVRPNSKIGDHVKVGDFVEIKNSVIGNGTKISHLTYVGDSDCGERINFGCGTVTTNYDGFKKFRCTIGDDAFIGCNTNLIAPVTVGNGSYIAAGSTITDEVPADSLAIARERQVNKPGWAEQWRAAHEKK